MAALDPEKTASFTLGPARGETRTAVLLLHGFTGSPWEVRPLGESLAARGFHVYAPLLPGHGKTPEAMLFVTWRDWVSGAEEALEQLEGFERIVIAGLSMGALLGLLLAAKYPGRVQGLAMMAPVVKLRGRDGRMLRLARRLPLHGLLPGWVKKTTTDIQLPEVRAESPILPRYPLARVFDLFELQDLVNEAIPRLRCKALVIAAVHDRVVAFDGVVAMQKKVPRSRLVVLQRGGHIIPRDEDRARAISEVAEFVDS